MILTVKKSDVQEAGLLVNGFEAKGPAALLSLLMLPQQMMEREAAETNEEYVQIIPYVIVRNLDMIYLYQRSVKQGEDRLHGKFSIGIGGHIEDDDVHGQETFADILANAIEREMDEEICFTDIPDPDFDDLTFIGLMYDPSTPVGRVHLGVMFCLEAADYCLPAEDTVDFFGYTRPFNLPLDKMESWSREVSLYLFPELR